MPQQLLILAFCALAGIALHFATRWLLRWRGVEVKHTRFGTTLIFDTQDEDGTPVRVLNVGGTFQSACYTEKSLRYELACEYQRTQAELIAGLPRLRRALVIGGGGFSLPKWMLAHLAPVHITTIEIDPAIIEIAHQRFYLQELEERFAQTQRFELVCDDAWAWLRTQPASVNFDLIVNEAFSGGRPLGALTSREGAQLIHAHLSEGGCYMATIRSAYTRKDGSVAPELQEVRDAFSAEFAHVWLIQDESVAATQRANHTLIASDAVLENVAAVTQA